MSLSGRRFGSIRIEDLIARGGMGDVYLGFHEKLKRKVAVKSILDSRRLKASAHARFLREARALSRLDHPNICKIYDYLEEEDGDLLVLEHIDGRLLSEVIAAQPSRAEKLEIAVQLADAIACAHDHGVIHRDIKPGNVMITADGTVKVLDFGISRFEMQGSPSNPGERTALEEDTGGGDAQKTRDGSLMGTLKYMSPEQARGVTATAVSDMFSLGLVLQELFSEEPPYTTDIPFGVLLRKVGDGDTLAFHDRDEGLVRLINRLKSPIPEARPSARDAVERLREITSGPARRRRRSIAWAAVALLVIFAAVMTWQSVRIQQEMRRANLEAMRAGREATTAGEVSEFLINLFELVEPGGELGKNVTARELLDRGKDKLVSLEGRPLDRARLMFTMGRMYRKLGLFEAAEPLLEQALTARRAFLGEVDLDVAESMEELVELYLERERIEEAVPLAEQALEIRERIHGPGHVSTASNLLLLARIRDAMGDESRARVLAERSLAIREAYLPRNHPAIGVTLTYLGGLLDILGENRAAERVCARAVRILEEAEDQIPLIDALNALARIHSQEGRYDDAAPLYERALAIARTDLGPQHPRVGALLNNVAVLYDNQGETEASLEYQRQAVEIWRKAYGSDHTTVAMGQANLALGYNTLGQFEESLRILEEVISVRERNRDPKNGDIAWEYLVKAFAEQGLGRFEAAERSWRRALQLIEADDDLNLELMAYNTELLANALFDSDRLEDAEVLFRSTLAWWDEMETTNLSSLSNSYAKLATILTRTDRRDEAAQFRARAEALEEQLDGSDGI